MSTGSMAVVPTYSNGNDRCLSLLACHARPSTDRSSDQRLADRHATAARLIDLVLLLGAGVPDRSILPTALHGRSCQSTDVREHAQSSTLRECIEGPPTCRYSNGRRSVFICSRLTCLVVVPAALLSCAVHPGVRH